MHEQNSIIHFEILLEPNSRYTLCSTNSMSFCFVPPMCKKIKGIPRKIRYRQDSEGNHNFIEERETYKIIVKIIFCFINMICWKGYVALTHTDLSWILLCSLPAG